MTQADFMQHVLSGTGGRVTPKDYLAFMKTGGVAARLQSNEVFYYEMEPLIQEIGGMRAGTGLMSAYQNLGQGRTTLRAARELERLGLVDQKLAEYDKLGHLLQIKPGGVRGGDLAGSDPMKMLTDVLLPAFKAHGIDITDNKAVINELSTVITNRTASALYATLFQQMDKIAKNMAVDAKAMGIKGLEEKAEGTPAAAEIKASNAWKDLRIQMGLDIIPIIIPMLNGLAGGLKALATAAHDHPIITSGLLLVAGAIGALAAVGGTVVLAVAGLKALAFVFTLPGFAGASLTGLAGNLGLVARGMLGMLGPIAAVVAALAYFKPPDDVVEKRLKDAQKNPLGVGKPGEGWLDNLFGFEAEPDDESAGLNTNRWAPPEPRVYGKVTAPLPPLSSSSAQPSPAADPGLVDRIAAAIKAALHGTAVMMDGQTVGRLVTDHQAREGDRPPSSSSLFDMRMAPLYPNQ